MAMFEHIGSVSHGTLRTEDLIPRFLDLLEEIDPDRATELSEYYGGEFDNDFFLDDLCMALDEHAPPGMYFGAHVGDSSDFGYWINWEAMGGDFVRVSDPAQLEDLHPEVSEAIYVNDHGNVTYYVAERKWTPVWSIV